MMDYNGYLVHGLKFCCESEAILTMPLNVVDNHIKQKLKRARKKTITIQQTQHKTKHTIFLLVNVLSLIQLLLNSCTSVPGSPRIGTPL